MVGGLINYLKKARNKARLDKVKNHFNKGNSYLFDRFLLSLAMPKANKVYLTIGDNCMLDCQVTFESEAGKVEIGNNTYIGFSQLICRNSIIVEDYVFIAWGCYVYDHDSHSIDYKERQNDINAQLTDIRNGTNFISSKNWDVVNSKPIKICSHAWVGMNSTILKGVTIGEGAIVGAGSVVTKDVAPWTIVAGNPAKVIKEIPDNLRKK